MKARREYVDYLRDILDAASKADRFIEGMEFADFKADEKTVFAVIRALEIIGEASKRIPQAIRRKYPDIPWREMAGMRDKISHEYFGVDIRRVFDTVRENLPAVRKSVSQVLEDAKK